MLGPIQVKMFRCQLKRYGIERSKRAVHLKMIKFMEMDSFHRAYSRFMVHKGKPSYYYSENGTIFTATEKEIKDGIAK